MKNLLKNCLNNHKVVSLYFDREDNGTHLTGFINSFNTRDIVVAHITPRGEYDGFILKRMNSLYRAECDGAYEKKIGQLYEIKRSSHLYFKAENENLFSYMLNFAKDRELIVTLELLNDSITGFVGDFDSENVNIHCINEYGCQDGNATVKAEEITAVYCDTDNENDLKLLNNEKNKKAQKMIRKSISGIQVKGRTSRCSTRRHRNTRKGWRKGEEKKKR